MTKATVGFEVKFHFAALLNFTYSTLHRCVTGMVLGLRLGSGSLNHQHMWSEYFTAGTSL